MFLALLLGVWKVAAATGNTRLTITVTDAKTHSPIPLAKVTLRGESPLVGLTGVDGVVTFLVDPGSYVGYLSKASYADTTIRDVRVESGTSVDLAATLSHEVGVIGVVRTTARPSYDPHRTEIDGSARPGGDLVSSLGTNPDVFSAESAGNSNGFSIDGHAQSQSGLLLDGVPIARAGGSANLRAFPGGIFDAATSSGGSSVYGQGGTLDLHVPDPTLAYSYSAQARSGSIGQSASSGFVRGTIGFLGFSVGHASQGDVAVIDAAAYLDETGTFYTHRAASQSTADVLKLRVPVSSSNILTATFLSSLFTADDYCLFQVGVTPCGFGPGAFSGQRLRSYQAKDRSLIGSVSVAVGAFSSSVSGSDARPHRSFNGSSIPISIDFASLVRGYTLDASLYLNGRSTFSLQGLTFGTSGRGFATIGQVTAGATPEATSFTSLFMSDAIALSDRLSATLKVGTNKATGTRGTPAASAVALWNMNRRDRFTASLSTGTVSLPYDARQGLSDIASLTYDCRSGVAFGSAPGHSNEASEATEARASLTHRDSVVNYDVSVYHQVLHGALVSGWTSASALPLGSVPVGYLGELQNVFQSPTICGSSAFNNLVLTTQSEQTAIYDGATASAKVTAGRVSFQPFYSYTRAVPVVSVIGTSIVHGSQLLGVPLNRFGAAVDWKTQSQRIEAAIVWRHVDGNNPTYLPAYDVFDIGATARGRGQLSLTISNVFNRDARVLSGMPTSASSYVPGAGDVHPSATPLRPRTISLSYRLQTGASSRPTNEDSGDGLLPTSTEVVAPQIPDHPSQTPFAVDRNNSQCGPEQAVLAKAVLDALAGYVASGKYVPVYALPNGEKAILRKNTDGSPVLLISGTRAAVQIAIFSCSTFYAALAEDVRAHGGYVPNASEGVPYELLFAPSIGLYVTLDPKRTVRRTTHATKFSGTPPTDAFATSSTPDCPTELRGAVEYTLGKLRTYFNANSAVAPDGVTIVRHDDGTQWYSLKFDDPSIRDALESCAFISSLTDSEAQRFEIGVDRDNTTIDYAKRVGLYIRSEK